MIQMDSTIRKITLPERLGLVLYGNIALHKLSVMQWFVRLD